MNGYMSPDTLLAAWHHGRFEVRRIGTTLHFRDWLMPQGHSLPASQFADLADLSLAQAWFTNGLVPSALGAAIDVVANRPRDVDDPLFWQYPCRTEGAAWDVHAAMPEVRRVGNDVHLYLGLPWATWIDKERKQAWGGTGLGRVQAQWRRARLRLRGLRAALSEVGLRLRVHTVCQHIYWADLLPRWEDLGITDLWLSHCPPEDAATTSSVVALHPWRLFAVNVEDESRRQGLQIGRDPAARPLLASFVGAHAEHYLSDIRLRLSEWVGEPDVVIEVTGKWHFERVVYEEQVLGLTSTTAAEDTVLRYNRLLSDSVFSLCPAGAGANTLRLWESLASGAIPVLLGPWPRLPEGGTLSPVDWDAAVIRVTDAELSQWPTRLRSIPLEVRRSMQRAGMKIFQQCQSQRCF